MSMSATLPALTRKAQELSRTVARYSPGGSFSAPKKPPPSVVAVRLRSADSMTTVAPSSGEKPITAPPASNGFAGGVALAANGPFDSAAKNSSLVRFGFGGTALLVL